MVAVSCQLQLFLDGYLDRVDVFAQEFGPREY